MPLNWNVTKVAKQEDLCWITDERGCTRVNPVTEALVFLTMGVGIPEITAKNAEEFAVRVSQWEGVHGAMLNRITDHGVEPRPITLADVQDHVGLATNASARTRTRFERDLRKAVFDKVLTHARENPVRLA